MITESGNTLSSSQESGNTLSPSHKPDSIKYIIFIFSIAIIALALMGWLSPNFSSAIAFNDSISTNIGGLLTILALISFALESVLEICVSILRDTGFPKDPEKMAFATRTISLVAGVFIGIMGVRILQPFVNLSALAEFQLSLFHTVDILLTAAILSGGSDGTHQLRNIYEDLRQSYLKGH